MKKNNAVKESNSITLKSVDSIDSKDRTVVKKRNRRQRAIFKEFTNGFLIRWVRQKRCQFAGNGAKNGGNHDTDGSHHCLFDQNVVSER